MSKRSICLTCAVLSAAALVRAQESPEGHWDGSVAMGPGRIQISLDLSKNAKSEWVASGGDATHTGAVIQDVTVNGRRVSFVVPEMMARWDLTMVADGTMKGTFTMEQGPPIGVEFKRTGKAKVELRPPAPAVSNGLEGDWESTQKGPGGLASYPMIFHFKNQPDKTVSATMDIFRRYVRAIPLDNVKQTGRNVEFELQLTHAAFKGTLNREGTELSGEFSQEQDVVQLTLHKRTDEAKAKIAANPFVGTWKLNVEKSKFSDPAPRSRTRTVYGLENGMIFVQEGVDSQGMNEGFTGLVRFDGKERRSIYPGQTALCSVIDANTYVVVFKADGKETKRVTEAISNGGRTLTSTTRGQGKEPESVHVFEKH